MRRNIRAARRAAVFRQVLGEMLLLPGCDGHSKRRGEHECAMWIGDAGRPDDGAR
jgi:hypothetical protein